MATTNINTEIFKRYRPEKKLEIINNLSQNELLAITPQTVIRILKETGTTCYGSRNKELRISRERRTGNNWNSEIESYYLVRKNIYVSFYFQYENTDTSDLELFTHVMRDGAFLGQVKRHDRYGNDRTYYFTYQLEHKAKAIRALLLEYVYTKYHDKLKTQEEAA